MSSSGRPERVIPGWLSPTLLVLFVGVLGLLPHFLISLQMGKLTYFKSAWDEDSYALRNFERVGPFVPSRLLSHGALQGLAGLLGPSWDSTYVAADFAFPILSALAAWLMTGLLSREPVLRLVMTLGLLFVQEFLSLSCAAVWPYGTWTVRQAVADFPLWRALLPDLFTTYFSLFRTPEPQVSLAVFFGLFLLLIRFVRPGPARSAPVSGVGLLTANAGLGFVYLFLAVPFVVVELACAAVLALVGKRRESSWSALFGLTGFASVALASFGFSAGENLQNSAAFLFRSHLPILTPASVLSAFFLGLIAFRLRRVERTADAALAAACFAAVLILTNQQIVSGWMLSARQWEFYSNYPLLLFGSLLWISASRAHVLQTPRRSVRVLGVVLLAIVLGVLLRGQLRVFGFFQDVNLKTVAMKRALEQVREVDPLRTTLVLDEPDLAPLLQFRRNGRLPCLLDFTDTIRRIPVMAVEGGAWGVRSPLRERLFEYFARTGRTQDQVSRILSQEADARSGFFLAFLFSHVDHWYPVTDDRGVRQAEIRAMIPEIVREYEAYVSSGRENWRQPALRLTTAADPRRVAGRCWRERVVARATIGGVSGEVTVRAFLQTYDPSLGPPPSCDAGVTSAVMP